MKTWARDAVAWAGSDGQLSDLQAVQLGPEHPALLMEGSCTGQGETTVRTQLVELEPAGARIVLPDLPVHEDTFGAYEGCEDGVRGLREPTHEELSDPFQSHCHEVTGRWRIEPAGVSGRGDFVVAYRSHGVEADPQTPLNTFVIADETVTYRYSAAGDERLNGQESRGPAAAVSPSAASPA